MNTREYEQWARARETDEEIAEAIHRLADTPAQAERIWEDPSREEWLAIWERVTKNGLLDGNDFQWGEVTLGDKPGGAP